MADVDALSTLGLAAASSRVLAVLGLFALLLSSLAFTPLVAGLVSFAHLVARVVVLEKEREREREAMAVGCRAGPFLPRHAWTLEDSSL